MADARKGLTDQATAAIKSAARAPQVRRFYKEVAVAAFAGGHVIALDGKPARTPGRALLDLPSREVAAAVAGEWRAQGEMVDGASMPLTRLANSAIDGVMPHTGEVAADTARYGGSDLICYRADYPAGLVALQKHHWDPVLAWAARDLDANLRTGTGTGHVVQPEAALRRLLTVVSELSPFRLAALHSMTTLMGSVLLAIAHGRGALDAEAAWAAAHVDEDWQISQWGADAEATARRAARWQDFQAASLVYHHSP